MSSLSTNHGIIIHISRNRNATNHGKTTKELIVSIENHHFYV